MKVAIYARVSREEQTELNQVPVLEAWAKQRGYEIADIYRDVGSAWQKADQKELKRLTEDARKGKFNVLLVWALDRLTRGGIGKISAIYDQMNGYGVQVISYQESWTEVNNELRPLLVSIIGWMANMESRRISDRTKLGMERARLAGKHIGRPRKKGIKIEQ